MYFDFAPFSEQKYCPIIVSSLEDLLIKLDELDPADGLPLQTKVVNDVVSGLKYLHRHDCFHRDLKTANIVVSNQHYCSLAPSEIDKAFKEPILCKLTDFYRAEQEKCKQRPLKVHVQPIMWDVEPLHTWHQKY